jgi:hypothetical protein
VSQTPRIANTITQLRTVVGFPAGTLAFVRGASAVDDGGGGLFYWSDAAAADDDGLTVNPGGGTGPGWRRLVFGPVDIRWIGGRPGAADPAAGDFGNSPGSIAEIPQLVERSASRC